MIEHDTDQGPDRLAGLMRQLAAGALDAAAAQELSAAIHQHIHPLCTAMLSGVEAAYDAEQETWLRVLEHLRRRDPAEVAILDGAAYVRQVARNVCHDLGRRNSQARLQVDVDDQPLATAPTWTDMTTPPRRSPLRRGLPAAMGYRSRRVLEDLGGLSEQERKVLLMRQQGWSYGQIAERLGGDLTQGTAQTQGERAMHHLRGRAHVIAWLEDDLRAWPTPPCPELAAMKAAANQRLVAGKELTTTLYRDIGRHLDPHPNRRSGSTEEPWCRICVPERKRSELTYWWLIVTLPPVLALPFTAGPAPSPVAAETPSDAPPTSPSDAPPSSRRRRRPRNRARTAALTGAGLVVAVIVIALAAVVVPPMVQRGNDRAAQPPAGAAAAPAASGPAGSAASGRAVLARPEPCKIVTQDDVARITGYPVDACTVQSSVSGATGQIYSTDGALGAYIWTDPSVGPIGVSSMVQVHTYDLGDDATAEFPTGCTKLAADPKLRTGKVPGLGDDNCRVSNTDGTVELVLTRRANIAIIIFVVMYDLKPETATELAKLALGRVR